MENENDLLFRYVCGESNEEEARQIEERAAKDADFARELSLARAATRLTTIRRSVSPKPFFWTRLSVRLDEEDAPRMAWLWVAKRLIPSMVMATLIVAFTLSYHQPDRVAETPETDFFALYDGESGMTDSDEISDTSILDSALSSPDETSSRP